ncbi:MAG: SURF1 family protein [Cypionkella sp.]
MSTGRGRFALPALCLIGFCLFAALGVWQLERRAWKLDLIERVERRIHAAPVPPPPPERWDRVAPREIEYRRVALRGWYRHEAETLVDALTERGPGFWVLTPLRTDNGTFLVNRGFVPREKRDPDARRAGQVTGEVAVTGLVRLSEPGGRFLRPNRPAEDRWYSRDVGRIAERRGLARVAPFFIDADEAPNPGGHPLGGLTIVRFRNTHLIYALTWFGLAFLCLFGLVVALRPGHSREQT